jgi:hypothetical protein
MMLDSIFCWGEEMIKRIVVLTMMILLFGYAVYYISNVKISPSDFLFSQFMIDAVGYKNGTLTIYVHNIGGSRLHIVRVEISDNDNFLLVKNMSVYVPAKCVKPVKVNITLNTGHWYKISVISRDGVVRYYYLRT